MKKALIVFCVIFNLTACSSKNYLTPVSGDLEKINNTEEIIYD